MKTSNNTERKWKIKYPPQFLLSLLSLILSDILFWCILLMNIGSHRIYLVLLPFPPFFLTYNIMDFYHVSKSRFTPFYTVLQVWLCQSPRWIFTLFPVFHHHKQCRSEHPCTHTFACLCWQLLCRNSRRKNRQLEFWSALLMYCTTKFYTVRCF